jgi:hypothetical protein
MQYIFKFFIMVAVVVVVATHIESNASQSQARNHPLLSSGSVMRFPWRRLSHPCMLLGHEHSEQCCHTSYLLVLRMTAYH